ncbi:MAG: helix-turn-helix domain-containing protein [Nitrosopumilus sp.]|nr:helix-turn-helix domain-containing protein [Nitrosopumilus sp.]MDH3488215.1 helix-turn-helix domain-containing protein [Nitrosopumilus sp.]
MDFSKIENDLISEIKLQPVQAKVYLLITCHGKMSAAKIAEKLNISQQEAQKASKDLMTLGAFIDITESEFEAMHPRFTAVNMYRKMCERENMAFGRNKIVDNMGGILEKSYDDARTK